MLRRFSLAALLILSACDSGEPAVPRSTDQQQVEISGYELYGVDATVESDGRIEYRISDEVTHTFRFGALPRLVIADACEDGVEVCSSIVLNRPTAVEVTLSRPVVADGETLDAGADLAGFLSTPDRDALLSIPPDVPETPDASAFVAFDPGRVEIPEGAVTVGVRWTTNSPSVTYTASRTLTFAP